jgi:hypothetical protein
MASRVRIERLGEGVRVLVPPRRLRWSGIGIVMLLPALAFALLAVVLFAEALGRATGGLPLAAAVAAYALVIAFPGTAAVAILAAELRFLYGLVGREVIVATPWMLTDARHVMAFSARRRWPAMRISGLRLSPMSGGAFDPRLVSRRGLLFEVDGRRTVSMAEGCTPAEAAEVLAAVDAALKESLVKREVAHER